MTELEQLREKLERLKAERDNWKALASNNLERVLKMRSEYQRLAEMACDFIGPDEDNKPECTCCGMSLETVSKGHRRDCLAAALLENGTQHIFEAATESLANAKNLEIDV